MERHEFTDCLKNFNSISDTSKVLIALVEKTELQSNFAKQELLCLMEQEIINGCSPEFLKAIKKDVCTEIKEANCFGRGPKSYLEYLIDVIFIPLTKSHRVNGFDYFIAPGNTPAESAEFGNIFFKDFIRIKEMFRLELAHCPEVKIGFAYRFYVPQR